MQPDGDRAAYQLLYRDGEHDGHSEAERDDDSGAIDD